MTQNLQNYTKALYGLDAIVRRVPAAAWDNQSPCEEWTAREVLGHTMWGMKRAASLANGTGPPTEQAEADVAGPDPTASWAEARDMVLQGLDQQGALQSEGEGPFGPMKLDDMLTIATMDILTHTWDIAQAADIDHFCDEPLLEQGLAGIQALGDGLRRPGLMGPEVEAAEGADIATRFANYSGRTALR